MCVVRVCRGVCVDVCVDVGGCVLGMGQRLVATANTYTHACTHKHAHACTRVYGHALTMKDEFAVCIPLHVLKALPCSLVGHGINLWTRVDDDERPPVWRAVVHRLQMHLVFVRPLALHPAVWLAAAANATLHARTRTRTRTHGEKEKEG